MRLRLIVSCSSTFVIDLEPGEFRRLVARQDAGDNVDAELFEAPSSREATFTSSPIAE